MPESAGRLDRKYPSINWLGGFDSYGQSRPLGVFILVDQFSHAAVAAGLIRHSLRRSQNVHQQPLAVGWIKRERLNGNNGKVVWFTALSGSGG